MEEDAEFYSKRSNQRFAKGDMEGAISDINHAIHLDPNNLEYYRSRGNLRYHSEEYQLAVEDFTKIIQLGKNINQLTDIYNKRAISYEKLGLHGHLLRDLDWLIEHGFGTATIYAWRGHHRLKMGDGEGAIRDFTIAHESWDPESSEALLQRAQAYYQAQRYEEAVQDLTQIAETYKLIPLELVVIYIWRGRAYYGMGKHQEALIDFKEAVRIEGENPYFDAASYMRAYFPEDIEAK